MRMRPGVGVLALLAAILLTLLGSTVLHRVEVARIVGRAEQDSAAAKAAAADAAQSAARARASVQAVRNRLPGSS